MTAKCGWCIGPAGSKPPCRSGVPVLNCPCECHKKEDNMALKRTTVRRKDIDGLTKKDLADLVWKLTKEADWYAAEFNKGEEEPRNLCVMSPGQVLESVEEAVR